jgi:hypothetical protein
MRLHAWNTWTRLSDDILEVCGTVCSVHSTEHCRSSVQISNTLCVQISSLSENCIKRPCCVWISCTAVLWACTKKTRSRASSRCASCLQQLARKSSVSLEALSSLSNTFKRFVKSRLRIRSVRVFDSCCWYARLGGDEVVAGIDGIVCNGRWCRT